MIKPFQDRLLPGQDLVEQGLADLKANRMTENALLVLIAAPRLRRLGIEVPERSSTQPFEHQLYERIEQSCGTGAHSQYNSLLRRMDSFAHALEREQSLKSS